MVKKKARVAFIQQRKALLCVLPYGFLSKKKKIKACSLPRGYFPPPPPTQKIDAQLVYVYLRTACCTDHCHHCRFFLGSAQYEGSENWDDYLSSLRSEPVTEGRIYQISSDVGRKWKDLLRSLSIKEKTIENLSVDFKHETITEQCIQGLIKWKDLDPQLATIKTLAIALRNVGCFDALRTLQKLR